MRLSLCRYLLLIIGSALVLLAVPLTAQDIPEEILIESEGYRTKLYQPVEFTHLVHVEDYGIECAECHHDYKGGENVWQEGDPVKKCSLCHSPVGKQGDVHRLVFAFHFNCKRCHKENESGPMECGECHTKR